jgi:hypothetical protein
MALRVFPRLLLCCVLIGCAGQRTGTDKANEAATRPGLVMRGTEMSGSVINALQTRMPSARINTRGPCPQIVFRGDLSARNPTNPSVYVDGTLMGDTCVLNSIYAQDVDRVEIYSNGNTPYSTIQRNASGVILIFRRRE